MKRKLNLVCVMLTALLVALMGFTTTASAGSVEDYLKSPERDKNIVRFLNNPDPDLLTTMKNGCGSVHPDDTMYNLCVAAVEAAGLSPVEKYKKAGGKDKKIINFLDEPDKVSKGIMEGRCGTVHGANDDLWTVCMEAIATATVLDSSEHVRKYKKAGGSDLEIIEFQSYLDIIEFLLNPRRDDLRIVFGGCTTIHGGTHLEGVCKTLVRAAVNEEPKEPQQKCLCIVDLKEIGRVEAGKTEKIRFKEPIKVHRLRVVERLEQQIEALGKGLPFPNIVILEECGSGLSIRNVIIQNNKVQGFSVKAYKSAEPGKYALIIKGDKKFYTAFISVVKEAPEGRRDQKD